MIRELIFWVVLINEGFFIYYGDYYLNFFVNIYSFGKERLILFVKIEDRKEMEGEIVGYVNWGNDFRYFRNVGMRDFFKRKFIFLVSFKEILFCKILF